MNNIAYVKVKPDVSCDIHNNWTLQKETDLLSNTKDNSHHLFALLVVESIWNTALIKFRFVSRKTVNK